MKQKKMSALLCLMTLSAMLCLLPVGVLANTTLLNGGYPYGYDMNGDSITLAVDVDAQSGDKYQWQCAPNKEDFGNNNFTSLGTGKTITLNMQGRASGWWYRCSVNDGMVASEPVQIVRANEGAGTADDMVWTRIKSNNESNYKNDDYREAHWFISNGEMAYWVNGGQFNVMGSCVVGGKYYMLQTSWNGYWTMYQGDAAVNSSNELTHLKLSFSNNSRGILFEAKLKGQADKFCIKADTQLGDYGLLKEAADQAVLKAQLSDDRLDRITLMGVRSFSDANGNTPAMAITPDASTPSSKFWIGKYNSSKTYAYNSQPAVENQYSTTRIGSDDVVTLVQNTDTEMTLSWEDVDDGIVKFKFGVGTMIDLGMVQCDVNYENECLTGLLPQTIYKIAVRNASSPSYTVKTDTNGSIALSDTDQNGNAYSFFGEHLEIGRKGSTDITKEIVIAARPDAVLPQPTDVTLTQLVFLAESGQEYEYWPEGGPQWIPLTAADQDANGKYMIANLPASSQVRVRTRVLATSTTPRSVWEETSIQLLRKINAAADGYTGNYDGVPHGISVAVPDSIDDATVTYSASETGTYTRNQPTMKDADSYTVYYRVTATGYTPQEGSATVTISPRPITVTADSLGKTYGDTDPALTYSVGGNGLVAGEALSGALGRNAGETAGEYAITQGTLTNAGNPNYAITFTGAMLTISPKVIHVTITANGGVYDGTPKAASAEPVGYVADNKPAVTLKYTGTVADGMTYGPSEAAPTDAGIYTVEASISDSNYELKSTNGYPTQRDFVVGRSETKFAWLKINEIETLSAEFTYGDSFTVKVKPEATGTEAAIPFMRIRQAAPTPKQMALFIRKDGADTQITAPASADLDGVYTMVYSTADKALAIGANKVVAKFVGDANMADYDQELTITLKQRELTVTDLKLEERSYIPGDSTVRILSATLQTKALDTDDVTLAPDTIGTLPGEGSGDYTEVTLPNPVPLAGEHAGYYTAGNAGATLQLKSPIHIGKAPLDLKVSIKNWVEGEKAQTPVVTGNLGGGKETFTYKLVTEPDTAYKEPPPVKAGRYVVKAVVAETQNYLAGEATAEFDVIAVPALPQTGDDSRLTLWLALCLLTGAGMLGLERRRRNN